MKCRLTFIFLIVAVAMVHGQNSFTDEASRGSRAFPDSVRVEFQDQNALIVFQFKKLKGITEKVGTGSTAIRDAVKNIEKGIQDLSTPHRVDVRATVTETGIVITESTSKSTRIQLSEKEVIQLLPPGWEMFIHLKEGEVYVYAQTFGQLKSISEYDMEAVDKLLEGSLQTRGIGRKRMIAKVIVNKNAIVYNDVKFQMPEDFLMGTASSGLGYLGDKFYPEFNFTIAVRRGNHFNRPRNKFALTYNNLFFMERKPDGGFSVKTNSFLSLSWTVNADNSGQFIGLGAGYLILKQGDYFKGKTAKFFISKDIGQFNIAPEFNLTNDFKSFQPGIRLNYTF